MAKSKLPCCLCVSLLCVIAIIILCIAIYVKRGCSEGDFRLAAVAADSRICSEVGRHILQQGGSAVDGAIAALLCTSVVNPQSMGLGGGSIFTVMDRTGTVKIINSRETVPNTYKADLLANCSKRLALQTGSQWIGVPGEIRGYEKAHALYGKLPWAKLFEPAIQLARKGIPLPAILSRYLQHPYVKPHVQASLLCDVFCHENKTVLQQGETLRFPKLAQTMEAIVSQGADVFYTGHVAKDLVKDIQAAGGTLTMEDLKSYKVKVTDAWTVPFGDYTMHVPPPPAGGAILSFLLNIMKEYHLTPSSIKGAQKVLTYHRYAEASKFANGQRRNIRDPFFSSIEKKASHLMSEEFAARVRAMISDNVTHDGLYYRALPDTDHLGTTHVSVLAADGTTVSVTSTINQLFGSMVYSQKTGVILNNELADFCGMADHISAGEQPPSSMTPAILHSKSKKKTLVIGGAGGSLIITAVAQSIMNHLWFGKSLEESIATPILFVSSNNLLNPEPGFDKAVMKELKELGHSEGNWTFFLNAVNAVSKEDDCISAVSDARKLGKAAGY